jgi:hypothetical protein
MGSTLLQLVQQVTNEIGVSQPTFVVTNPNADVIQIYALMNACGYELLRKADWTQLTQPYTFFTNYLTTTGTYSTNSLTISALASTSGLSTQYMLGSGNFPNGTFVTGVNSGAGTCTINNYPTANATNGTIYFQQVQYSYPAGYDSIVPRTQWDKSKHWEMLGPESAQQWEWLLSGYISTGPRVRWRLFQGYFQIWPGFSNNEFLGFEYRSNAWAMSAGGTAQTSFLADTDTCIYKDRLMVNMCKYKYFSAKGLPTQDMYRNYLTELETDIAQDTSGANLSFAPRPGSILIGYDNIPDSGYGPAGS